MVERLIYILILICISLLGYSQDPTVSQPNLVRNYINPAYAGFTTNLNFSYTNRNQWNYLPDAMSTNIFSLDNYCSNSGFGLGLLGMTNKEGEGVIKTTNVSGLTSYTLSSGSANSVGKFMISGALQVGILQKKIDWDNLVFSDELDNIYGNIYTTNAFQRNEATPVMADIGGGTVMRWAFEKKTNDRKKVSYTGSYITLGAAVQHMNQPDESIIGIETKLPRRYNIHSNLMLRIIQNKSGKFYEKPASYIGIEGLYQQQGQLRSIRTGVVFTHNNFLFINLAWRGSSTEYRNTDSFIFSVLTSFPSIKINKPKKDQGKIVNNELKNTKSTVNFNSSDVISVGLNYDLTSYPLSNRLTKGTWELVFRYDFTNRRLCRSESQREARKRIGHHNNCPAPGGTNYQMLKNNPTKKEHDALKKSHREKDMKPYGFGM